MAQPSSREGLIDYANRQFGFPVLEINVADEQFQDLLDEAMQNSKRDITMVSQGCI